MPVRGCDPPLTMTLVENRNIAFAVLDRRKHVEDRVHDDGDGPVRALYDHPFRTARRRLSRYIEQTSQIDDGDHFFAILGDPQDEIALAWKLDDGKRVHDLPDAQNWERVGHRAYLDSNQVFGESSTVGSATAHVILQEVTLGRSRSARHRRRPWSGLELVLRPPRSRRGPRS